MEPECNIKAKSKSQVRVISIIDNASTFRTATPPIANWPNSDVDDRISFVQNSLSRLNRDHTEHITGTYSLAKALFERYKRLKQKGDLDKSIEHCTEAIFLLPLSQEGASLRVVRLLFNLALSLLHHSRDLDQPEDVNAIEYLRESPDSVRDLASKLTSLLVFVRSIIFRNPQYSEAATSHTLMQKSLSSAPAISIQNGRLVAMGWNCQTMPLDHASFQVGLGRFEGALEVPLWSELRGLRLPMYKLINEDSPLIKRLTELNQDLGALITSVAPSGRPEIEDGDAHGDNWKDPFDRLVVKQENLVEERDLLISQVRSRPGLEGFLKTPSFTTLRSAASRGPVILINHCRWRSDILFTFDNSPPCSIPTVDDFYDRTNKIRDELVEARKHGLDSCEYQDTLCVVLKTLYELVGAPVINKLRVLGVPEQSRIWWCPTSVFCSLPLHAMGPIPSSDGREQYFSDIYIPSYTPSLSALMESRNTNPQILDRPSLLLVAQPEDSLLGVNEEIKVIRSLKRRVTVTDLVSSEATPSSVVEGLRGNQFAHFACHGVLEAGKPLEASFMLHEGSRLTLLDIVQSRLPHAEFAFLSCCHSAEITEDSIPDEMLHLTAAMRYCGFRSVVGTMWEMADTDGQYLAKSFYKSLFSGQEDGVPYYERTARSLRDATQKLRKKRGVTLERWVNFVHYGA
ncbi:CHAT domain-containing protein [Lactarius quietus]|nr:CHAT domain-containing protein [Lactarius quietus]